MTYWIWLWTLWVKMNQCNFLRIQFITDNQVCVRRRGTWYSGGLWAAFSLRRQCEGPRNNLPPHISMLRHDYNLYCTANETTFILCGWCSKGLYSPLWRGIPITCTNSNFYFEFYRLTGIYLNCLLIMIKIKFKNLKINCLAEENVNRYLNTMCWRWELMKW